MLIETDYLNYPPIRINLTSATPRTTGCFDDRLLTMMTDTGFYVPWRVGYNFRLAKLLKKPSGTLWWMSTLVSKLWEILQKQGDVISLTNKSTLDHHFRGFLRKVTQKNGYQFKLCVSPSKTAICTYIQENFYHLAAFQPNLKPQFDFIKLLEPIKDDR